MSEQYKELFRQFAKHWDAGDVDAFGDFIATDTVDHTKMPGTADGLEGVKQQNAIVRGGFSNTSTEIHEMLAEGDKLAVLQTVRGTHTGEFMGIPPTGKSYEVPSIHILRFADGKAAEHWGMLDQGAMMMQLGLMPMPPGTESWRPPPSGPQVTGSASGDPDAHRKAMGAMIAHISEGNVEELLAGIDENVVDHSALPGQGPGRDGIRTRFEQLFAGMREPVFTTVASVGEGPFLSQAHTLTATHTGPMMGLPPTNKSFTVNAIDFVRFENGKMREHWGLIDVPSLMMQLGLAPPPPG